MALAKYGKPSKDVKLFVKYEADEEPETAFLDGISEIFNKGLLADVTLIAAEGREKFSAHKLVLAAKSPVLMEMFSHSSSESGTQCEVRLYETCAGAVRSFLDFVYNREYQPRNEEVNKDVLKLANQFRMPVLIEKCSEELAKNITTTNVVDKLQLCDEFELLKLRNKIMQQLTSNKKALQDVAESQQILQYPLLLQEMLGLMAKEGAKEQEKKKQEAAQKTAQKKMSKAKEALGLKPQETTEDDEESAPQTPQKRSLKQEAQEAAEPQSKRRNAKK